MNKKIFISMVVALLVVPNCLSGNSENEQKNVLTVVNQFLQMLETGDTELAKKILVKEGSNFSLREKGEGSFDIRFTTYESLIKSLPKTKGKYKEVIKKPKVLLYKGMAVVWAPYRFYIDGEFSHCGIDSFSLVKDGEKWKIASIIYTVEKKLCK